MLSSPSWMTCSGRGCLPVSLLRGLGWYHSWCHCSGQSERAAVLQQTTPLPVTLTWSYNLCQVTQCSILREYSERIAQLPTNCYKGLLQETSAAIPGLIDACGSLSVVSFKCTKMCAMRVSSQLSPSINRGTEVGSIMNG